MTLADDIFDYKQKIKEDLKARYPNGIKEIAPNVILIEMFSKMDDVIKFLGERGY